MNLFLSSDSYSWTSKFWRHLIIKHLSFLANKSASENSQNKTCFLKISLARDSCSPESPTWESLKFDCKFFAKPPIKKLGSSPSSLRQYDNSDELVVFP